MPGPLLAFAPAPLKILLQFELPALRRLDNFTDPPARPTSSSTVRQFRSAGPSNSGSPTCPAAPATPAAIIPKAADLSASPVPAQPVIQHRPAGRAAGTGETGHPPPRQTQDNRPRDTNIYTGLRQAADLPVSCIHRGPSRGNDDIREALVNTLCPLYVSVLHKLPVQEMPELLGCVVYAGQACGLLEPIHNIIISALSYHPFTGSYSGEAINDGVFNPSYWTQVATSSVQGLVTFLRCYFHYLSEDQALAYLYLANADLVLAIGLVEEDQQVPPTFHKLNLRTFMATKLAAQSAGHHEPEDFAQIANGYFDAKAIDRLKLLLSKDKFNKSTIHEIINLLKGCNADGKMTLYAIRSGDTCYHPSNDVHQQRKVKRRDHDLKPLDENCCYIHMLKMLLMDRDIKLLYLGAISRLSKDVVCRLSHGLAVASHYCGYFHDPIHNIIINSIWYTLAFPEEDSQEESLICADRLFHVINQSVDGSVAFLQARRTTLGKHEALEYLYSAKGVLSVADEMAGNDGHTVSCSRKSASKAAVNAMGIMWAAEIIKLIDALSSGLESQLINLMSEVVGEISVDAINSIASLLSHRLSFPVKSLPILIPTLIAHANATLVERKRDFLKTHRILVNIVKKLLKNDENGQQYKLHSICGAKRIDHKNMDFFHINFLVVKDDSLIGRRLFFSEIWLSPRKDRKSFICELGTGVPGMCTPLPVRSDNVYLQSF